MSCLENGIKIGNRKVIMLGTQQKLKIDSTLQLPGIGLCLKVFINQVLKVAQLPAFHCLKKSSLFPADLADGLTQP